MNELRNKTIKSFLWVSIDVFGQRILQFIIGIILARLLLPEDYGLIGLIAIFISFSMVFVNSGFAFTLIRQKEVAEDDYYTVFWFNLIVSVLFFILLWISSHSIASFYDKPVLSAIVKVVALNIVVQAIGSIQNIQFSRELQFKEISLIGMIAKISSGAVSIGMAYSGFGVWALVTQQLLMNIVHTSLLWAVSKFRLRPVFSFSRFKQLFSFSSKILYTQITGSVLQNIYPLLIGKFFNVAEVGFFTKAKGLQELPVLSFMGIIQRVTLPAFTKIQDNTQSFKCNYQKAIKISVFLIGLPLMILFVTANPLISFLLTEKWLPAAPYLKILVLGGIFYPLNALNYNIVGIKGRANFLLIQSLFSQLITVASILIGLIWGVYGLVVSFTVRRFISYLLNVYFTNKVMHYPLTEQIGDIIKNILILLISGLIGYFMIDIFSGDLSKIVFVSLISTSIYLFLVWLFRLDVLYETHQVLKEILRAR